VRLLRDLSTVLLIAGALLIADAATTVLWQEPVSALLAQNRQDDLAGELHQLETAPATPLEREALARLSGAEARIAFLARYAWTHTRAGTPIGRIEIPRIHADYVMVQGTDTASLEKGPGHYVATAFPGLGRTIAVAGHRTTYLAPFRHIDELRAGDQIIVQMPYGTFTYGVETRRIVRPTAVWVTRDRGYERLVLSACHPLYSAARRIVVFARLLAETPRGAALTAA
jgi:sortase A